MGRTYPPTAPYQVSQAKITEFAVAIGDGDNPAYQGPGAIAPPTFAAVLSAAAWNAIFTDPDLDLALSRTVHVDQRFEFIRPLRPGDDVRAQLTIDNVRARGSMALITFSVKLTTTDGEDVAVATSTLMHQEAK